MRAVRKGAYSSRSFSAWARDWMPDDLTVPDSEDEEYVTGGTAFEAYWRTLLTDCLAVPTRRLGQEDVQRYANIFNEWRREISLLPSSDQELEGNGKFAGDEALIKQMTSVASRTGIASLTREWQFAELDGGVYAMVPWEGPSAENREARIGDLVVVVEGGKVPLTLREKERNNHGGNWEVVGTAYAHGFMDGRASQWTAEGKLTEREFVLI